MEEDWDDDDSSAVGKWSLGVDSSVQQKSSFGWSTGEASSINGNTEFGGGKSGFSTVSENNDDDGWEDKPTSFGSQSSGFGSKPSFGSMGRGGGGILGGNDADDAGGHGGRFGRGLGRGSRGGFRGGNSGSGFGRGGRGLGFNSMGSGSACRSCGEEGHFARDCPNNSGGGRGGSGCRLCGEDGHFAKECPKKGVSGRSGACRICNEEGHFAKECPNKSGSGFGSGGEPRSGFAGAGGMGGGSRGCRICHEEGHFAKECPTVAGNEEKPQRVSYVPPDPSEKEEEIFRTIAQGINFDKYDEINCEVTGHGNIPKAVRSFEEAGLCEKFLENVKKAKYRKPTPVQKYAIPIILGGRDLMACAQTGSGKTAAFLLPVLTAMRNDGLTGSALSEVQAPAAIIISPTRELASQTYMETRKFSQQTMIRPVVCYGGVSVGYQLAKIREGCHIIVATPGRLKQFASMRKISLEKVKFLILDEADRMLDMGFMPEVKAIVRDFGMPPKGERQTLMFSATFPEEIQKLASEFLNDYVFLTIGRVGGTSSDIEQVILDVPESQKRDKLVEILGEQGLNRNLVFVQTKRSADFLASFLSQSGFPTTSIHGDRLQQQREEALFDFREGRCPVLIATAVAARGLDIEDVKQVINYDLPDEIDEYVHRIGRTGRIGNQGKAISFFSSGKDEALARALVKILSDSNQVVPSWLEDAAEYALGTGYGPKGGKYGGKDTRKFTAKSDDFHVGVYNAGNDGDWDNDVGVGGSINAAKPQGSSSTASNFSPAVGEDEDDWG